MKYMGINEIRETFLSFFESKEHLRLKSFSLVPENDKSLLLINAGMAPLKPYFTGVEKPPKKRVATCQKCMRTGDIDNVGITARHHTFFEMLGNFSFGDYFKEEIIPWSWEFCTKILEIPEERLFVSVYYEDDEAFNIWRDKVGLPEEKIFRMGKEDNFWEVGQGPCGPCSEIYYDRGEKYGCGSENCTVGCECDRFMEFWNLVFTQFNKEEDGSYTPLAKPNIDTGMGLERMGVIMQDVDSVYDVDTTKAIRDKVCEIVGYEYFSDKIKDISIRIISDHIRSVTFMLADGVLPNNEGRGYVLRRLLRRAARHGKILGIKDTFMDEPCRVVIENFKRAYPELEERKEYILKILSVEESKFYETLDQGLELLQRYISKTLEAKKRILEGVDAFKLYDTFGFPIELMKEILAESDLAVDEERFFEEMDKQRQLSRSGREENTFMGSDASVYFAIEVNPTVFVGYENLVLEGEKIAALVKEEKSVSEIKEGENGVLIFEKTVFYAESGGQMGDRGQIENGENIFVVTDCTKVQGGKFAHMGFVKNGEFKLGQAVKLSVSKENRLSTMRNHTATHLLHKALRTVLGGHVEQAGSFVSSEKLRFDFAHFEAMTDEEIEKVEKIVNDAIFDSMMVEIINTDINSAKSMGAMALFGEKYGNEVRVVNVNNYSIELCGGTHVENTSQIGMFKLLGENGVSAGVRRIEALTGKNALEYFKNQEILIKNVSSMFKSTPENMIKKAEGYISQAKELRQQIEKLRSKMSGNIVDDIIASKAEIGGINCVLAKVNDLDMNGLRLMGDNIKDKLKSGVIVLASGHEDKVNLVVMASDDVVSKGIHAGNIIKEIAPIVGGKGGGKPNMAQAGGKDSQKIEKAFEKAKEIINIQLDK